MDPITLSIPLITAAFNKLSRNEEVKGAVDDFITDSVRWIRGWFAKGSHTGIVTKLQTQPTSPETEGALRTSLEDLLKDDKFKAQLMAWVRENQSAKPSMKNVLEDADIEVEGDITIGDKAGTSENRYDTKNVVRNSKIKGGGSFTLGDQ